MTSPAVLLLRTLASQSLVCVQAADGGGGLGVVCGSHVLTVAHVVGAGADRASVASAGTAWANVAEPFWPAEVAAIDQVADIAVLTAPRDLLAQRRSAPVTFDPPEELRVQVLNYRGRWLSARLRTTRLTLDDGTPRLEAVAGRTGVLSGAAVKYIMPGTSGSPVFDQAGAVVGLVSTTCTATLLTALPLWLAAQLRS